MHTLYDAEVVRMKRLISFLLALLLVLSAFAFAETADEGDDSNPVPIEAEEDGDDSEPVPLDAEDEGE